MDIPANNLENDPVIMIPQRELDDANKVFVIQWFATSLLYETSAALDLEVHVAVKSENGTIEFNDEVWHTLQEATDGCAQAKDGTFVTCLVVNPPDEFVASHKESKAAFEAAKGQLTELIDGLIEHFEDLQERRGEE